MSVARPCASIVTDQLGATADQAEITINATVIRPSRPSARKSGEHSSSRSEQPRKVSSPCRTQIRCSSRCSRRLSTSAPATSTSRRPPPPPSAATACSCRSKASRSSIGADTERMVMSLLDAAPEGRARRGPPGRLLVRHRRPRPLPRQRLQAARHVRRSRCASCPTVCARSSELGCPQATVDLLNRSRTASCSSSARPARARARRWRR